jgi:hypothetical protein
VARGHAACSGCGSGGGTCADGHGSGAKRYEIGAGQNGSSGCSGCSGRGAFVSGTGKLGGGDGACSVWVSCQSSFGNDEEEEGDDASPTTVAAEEEVARRSAKVLRSK